MNDSNKNITSALSVFLILASVLWGALNLREGLVSSRPASNASATPPPSGQLVTARLWQDPFETLLSAPREPATNLVGSGSGGSQELRWLQDRVAAAPGLVTILGVTLEGAPYPEDAEVRRRLRYAVEVGLLTADLAPEDATHIGVGRLPLWGDQDARRTLSTAYEWFSGTGHRANDRVLVLWLKEEDLGPQPLDTLSRLGAALGLVTRTNAHFCLIGPRSSDTLRAMVATNGPSRPPFAFAADRFRILSPEATAPDELLLAGATNSMRRVAVAQAFRDRLGADVFQNWIAPDNQLAEVLVRELTNRCHGVAKSNVIALVTEADTFYGRSLSAALTNAVAATGDFGARTRVWQFSYLRGLDGGKPATSKAEDKRKVGTSPEAELEAALRVENERADGEAQTDYARRLAEWLSAEDAGLRSRGSRILAVGLTGSDAYDKLLLLRALRPQLPEAVFFSTDLDARFWVASELNYTRNLLVASSYPLEPEPEGQESFFPFRDVYQAAVFRAVQAALRQARREPAAPHDHDLAGHLFEIGRHGPVQLVPREPAARASYGGRAAWVWIPAVYVATLGPLLLAIILLGGFHPRPGTAAAGTTGPRSRARARPRMWLLAWSAAAVTVAVGCLLLARAISQRVGEEPWTFTEGLSIWPTEAIRLVAVLCGVATLGVAGRQSRRHREALHYQFISDQEGSFRACLAEAKEQLAQCRHRGWWAFYKGLWLNPWQPEDTLSGTRHLLRSAGPESPETEVDARRLFVAWLRRSLVYARYGRVIPVTALYVAGLFALVLLTGGVPDRLCIRGPASWQYDSVLLGLSVVAFLLVLFYALDAARLTGRLLDCLTVARTRWPEWLTLKYAAEQRLRPTDLDGWLDMQFTAAKTMETGRLMFYPFLIFLLLLVSRNSAFERWTWPTSLIAVFVLNFLLAGVCWAFVRNSARRLRAQALDKLDRIVNQVNARTEETIAWPEATGKAGEVAAGQVRFSYARAAYIERLTALRTRIEQDRRGAFARGIQDPTYAALFLPTGITGILSVLLHYLVNQP